MCKYVYIHIYMYICTYRYVCVQFDPKTSNLIVRDVEEQLLRLTPSRALGGGEFYWESQWESTDGPLYSRRGPSERAAWRRTRAARGRGSAAEPKRGGR
jgi:hypothetical protein